MQESVSAGALEAILHCGEIKSSDTFAPVACPESFRGAGEGEPEVEMFPLNASVKPTGSVS
jgi:hypothetical protein